MEHQTNNAYGNGYKLDGKGYDWLLQHELAHEWLGNQLTNADWDDMWLHEGFGTYMQCRSAARWLNGERAMQAEPDHAGSLANRFPSRVRQTAGRGNRSGDDKTGPALISITKGR